MSWVTLTPPHYQLFSVMRISHYYQLGTNYLFHCRWRWHSSQNARARLSLCSRVKRAKEQNWCKQTVALLNRLLKCCYKPLQWKDCAFIHLRPHYTQLNSNSLEKSCAGHAKATQTQVDMCIPNLINKAMRSIEFPRACLLLNPTGKWRAQAVVAVSFWQSELGFARSQANKQSTYRYKSHQIKLYFHIN